LPITRTPDTVYRNTAARVTRETQTHRAYAAHARESGRQEGRTVAKSRENPAISPTTASPQPPTRLAAPPPPSRLSPLTTRLLTKYQLRDTTKEEK
jgi:hypothetical protein